MPAKKKRTERFCGDCGALISRHGPRVCDECARRKAYSETVLAGTRTILTRAGPVSLYIEPRSPAQRTTFGPAVPWLKDDSTCGEFLRRLIGALYEGLPYVRRADTQRLTAMLYELLQWKISREYGPRIATGTIEDLPLTWLDVYVRHWLSQRWSPPLLAYAALEAAWFIDAHFWGQRFEGRTSGAWEIEPSRPDGLLSDDRRVEGFEVLRDRRFKKDFTELYGGLLVECDIPAAWSLIIHHPSYGADDTIVRDGTRFRFGIERCPLSTTQGYPIVYSLLTVKGPGAFDLCSEFCGWGVLLPPLGEDRFPTIGRVPIGWIVAASEPRQGDPFSWELTALPSWLRGADERKA